MFVSLIKNRLIKMVENEREPDYLIYKVKRLRKLLFIIKG